MKVTTTPKDCDKVNKIVPIMQEHLGPVINLVRIKLLAFVLHALCVVQTVSLHKIASAMPTRFEKRYKAELQNNPAFRYLVKEIADKPRVILYSSHDSEYNNAVIVRDMLING